MSTINGNIIKEVLLEELQILAEQKQLRVCFVQFGEDAASRKFVAIKMNIAQQLGIVADSVASDASTTEAAMVVLQEIVAKEYDGVVLQLPVPDGMNSAVLVNAIPAAMDIDVLSTDAIELFKQGRSNRMPPVAAAVETILTLHRVALQGKHIVIRGKGALVGQPVAMLFERMNVAYTAIDIHTPPAEQQALLQHADIIISGTGVPGAVTPAMIKDGVVLIDAGTSEQSGKLAGDMDPACAAKASLYTPVPGGVGPIAVACLFKNLFLH